MGDSKGRKAHRWVDWQGTHWYLGYMLQEGGEEEGRERGGLGGLGAGEEGKRGEGGDKTSKERPPTGCQLSRKSTHRMT